MRNKILKSIILVFLLTFLINGISFAKNQKVPAIRFNEVLVINDSSAVDDFGMHSAWIELFNTTYNSVNIGGYYLTDDLNNPTKYWIPTGDPATKIPSRCYKVFWADNKPTRGIFHINFDLKEAKIIALFSANGKTLIDKVDLPSDHRPDVTYGRVNNDSDEWIYLEKSTPGANNDYSKKKSAGENFVEFDPYGVGMTVIAMMVVFSALAILFIIYKNLGKFFIRKAAKVVNNREKEAEVKTKVVKEEISGEVNAAIAMALYLYQNELHDQENTVLTIQKVSRTYSPWSSKIYTLRKSPR